MSVYNYAQQLAKELKESKEHKEYKVLEKKLKQQPKYKNMLDDYKRRQYEVQGLRMMGQKVDEKKLKEIQELNKELLENSLIAEFMQAEYKLTQMMADIYKILGEALDLDMGGLK